MKKKAKIGLFILATLFVILSIVPYFIHIPSYKEFSQDDVFVESYFEEIDGINLHYRLRYPREKPLEKILLVHGLGGSTFSWNNNVEYLQDAGYVVVAVDLPGFGYSSRKPNIDHSQKNRSNLLWKLLDSIEENHTYNNYRDWVLVGHSMGGGTVSEMAIARPNKTKALILVDAALSSGNRRLTSFVLTYPPSQSVVSSRFTILDS